ncbi:hypothetical protein T492DRAFT_262996 [Pavlovales sp. CCMP2436]|nr:hypothetical protein T492DRAFT_262996 [Pavlovales sp. CCMP2436]
MSVRWARDANATPPSPLQVTGASIYNLNRFNECEVGEGDRPLYPPTILGVEVLLDPFDDIVPRQVPKIYLGSCIIKRSNKVFLCKKGEEATYRHKKKRVSLDRSTTLYLVRCVNIYKNARPC